MNRRRQGRNGIAAASFALSCGFILAETSSSAAFDCKKASTKSEKAICADPAALAADAKLGKTYEALLGALDPAQRPELAKSQVKWIGERDSACAEKSGQELSACLAEQSADRVTAFLGLWRGGGGNVGGLLVPFFRADKGGPGRTAIDVLVYKFLDPETPAQRAFNVAVDKLTADIPQPDKGDKSDNFDFTARMTLAYGSPKLWSAQLVTSTYLGGAHPNTSLASVNIDVAGGRETRFADMMDKAKAAVVFKACAAQVLKQKKDNEGADADTSPEALKTLRETVASVSGDLALWTFEADKAVITYEADVVGAHAEGVFDCTLPYSELRALVKPGFPLP